MPTRTQAGASEFRRSMFLLCTLTFMGTEDQLMQAKNNRDVWATLNWTGRLELQVGMPLLDGVAYQAWKQCVPQF